MPFSNDYDCVIIGGGPAGATAATLLADHGHSVIVLERATFPRHHIGESLMPQTYDTFKRLGVLDKLKASACPRKRSVQFVSASGSDSLPYYFADRDPHERSTTWQVKRDDFDKMMLNNARQRGAEVREGVSVKEVVFEGSQAVGVLASMDSRTEEIRAKVVVDATGMASLLARQLDIREPDEALRNAAIYTYYKGTHRDAGRNSGATIIIHMHERKGWFWYIPLPDDVASIGVVAPPEYLFTGRGDEPLRTLEKEIAGCPGIRQRLEGAERIGQPYVTSDFSYRATRVSGHGWVLIGDAFGFLDPVYSSGVFLALKSGEFAADAIHDALGIGDVSGARLGCFGPKLAKGLHLIRQLVYAFYDKEFSFGSFSRKHPECRDQIVRLLIGDVFSDDVGQVFDVMREWTTLPAPVRLETD